MGYDICIVKKTVEEGNYSFPSVESGHMDSTEGISLTKVMTDVRILISLGW
jgi:hypothetical protein